MGATLNRLNPNQARRPSINKQPHPSQPCWEQSQISYRANAGERCTLSEFDRYVAVDPVKVQLNIAHVLGFVAKERHRSLTVGYVFEGSLSVSGRQLHRINQRRIVRTSLGAIDPLRRWPDVLSYDRGLRNQARIEAPMSNSAIAMNQSAIADA